MLREKWEIVKALFESAQDCRLSTTSISGADFSVMGGRILGRTDRKRWKFPEKSLNPGQFLPGFKVDRFSY
jgi:hypothetical protein